MLIHSTCRDCGGLLLVTNPPDDTVHPTCKPRPTKLERLTVRWLEAIQDFSQLDADLIEEQINELNNRPPRLREAALAYAGWGWPVFPLKPRSKTPATRNGFKDATTNLELIDKWWKRNPDSNIGLPTGVGFDVIDIDPPEGPPAFAALLEELEDFHVHGIVATASGGAHYYIKPDHKRGNKARIRPGIDTRGVGGYVVAPPSTLGEPERSWAFTVAPSPDIKPGMGA